MAADMADAIVKLAISSIENAPERFVLNGMLALYLHSGALLAVPSHDTYLKMRLTTYESGVAGPQRQGRAPRLWVKPWVSHNWTPVTATFELTPASIPTVAKFISSSIHFALVDADVTNADVSRMSFIFGRTLNASLRPVFLRNHATTVSRLRGTPDDACRALTEFLGDLLAFVTHVKELDE